ncbi:bifunctional (p)ppGpp synthetase/guanosine-3',5'-bis(diphosphate) 3'-pyrophosphohydrolase, partial [Candidatus Kaiserbacteria bacterium]|nr:bifunctional (p)ppGpp synthetase/guanosine-3',5'-bis(diphosphate) 3'-pyrophosphohydrolase [Candidatus Kaiserbacteria bacterium]
MTDVKEIIKLLESPSGKDTALITKAHNFAEKAHEGYTRYSGEPYFNHLFEVAKSLAQIGMGPNSIAVGFLHDSIEDVNVDPETIRKEFGEEILFLVEGVTKLGKLKYHGVQRHTESLRKLFIATSQDVRVVIIKLMDRRHNMMTLEHVPKKKQKRIALETLEVYVPIADRLGMGQIKKELEDLAFPYVFPKEEKEIQNLFKERSGENEKHLQKILKTIKKALGKEGIRAFRSEERIKGHYSLYKKLERKDFDISKIHDFSALRFIVPTVSDCYRVLGVVHGIWRPLPGKIKDYIAFPKPNGYQSIHTTVFTGQTGTIEIQIRTEQMHQEAQFGIASHMSYKAKNHGEKNVGLDWIRQFFPGFSFGAKDLSAATPRKREALLSIPSWIKQVAEENKKLSDSEHEEYLNEIKTDFFNHRVFTFTPKGDVIDLPVDSS